MCSLVNDKPEQFSSGELSTMKNVARGCKNFLAVLCENYGGWRWSILLRFWRILGVFGFGGVAVLVTVNLERIWH